MNVSKVLALVSIALSAVQSPPLTFDEAVKTARANQATAQGSAYEQQFEKGLTHAIESALSNCHVAMDRHISVTFVLRLDEHGTVKEIMAKPGGPGSDCVADKLRRRRFRKPPAPDYWTLIEVDLMPSS